MLAKLDLGSFHGPFTSPEANAALVIAIALMCIYVGIRKRGGPRFTVRRMLLVVTLLAFWLGWNARIVHQRKRTWDRLEAQGLVASVLTATPQDVGKAWKGHGSGYKPLSLIRQILGDVRRDYIVYSGSDLEGIRAMFPEATIMVEEVEP